ncbi:MAG: Gfo/Idh/MocA family oxidoreductase [Bryobacterales bacterium]|nr:Gfo/Idh/MocA family oxidoreductase [Bryobacterales bacterium]
MQRRTLIQIAGMHGFASAAAQAQPASDRVRVGVIGSGGRGAYLTAQFKEVGAEMSAVCDVYEPNLQRGLAAASTGAKAFSDYRRLLDDRSIDAVIVSTPDHWHAQMVIDAVRAGKDVYVEKPLCHTIPEGFAMVAATRETRRIVQVGTQRRSSPLFQEGKSIVDSGVLGDVRLVTSQWMNHQASLSSRPLAGALDWKQWLGPAPAREPDATRFFNWYYFWDYSGGLLIGQAAHIVDCIQWFLNAGAPSAVTCSGGQVELEGAEIPETASMILEFSENFLATFTIGYKAMRYHWSQDQIKQFHGDKARFDMMREGYALYPQSSQVMERPSREKTELGSFEPATRAHIRNFLDCCRTREEPNAPVEAGLNTAIALTMSLESLRGGRRIRWNPATRSTEA